ncbi:MAG TPA: hypothetical protein VEK79_17955 [Thermoanaerobaculia bacterium]|nr:hypothetical protein [Thermoanaerobaculia bacterium]
MAHASESACPGCGLRIFGRVHRLTVDTYAVQQAGGIHPDKS